MSIAKVSAKVSVSSTRIVGGGTAASRSGQAAIRRFSILYSDRWRWNRSNLASPLAAPASFSILYSDRWGWNCLASAGDLNTSPVSVSSTRIVGGGTLRRRHPVEQD